MYKYWLIYTHKGEFKGFKAIGFNSSEEIESFKEMFKSDNVFIDTIEKYPEGLEKALLKEYKEFVVLLKHEGDTEIPSFEEYKKDIEEM